MESGFSYKPQIIRKLNGEKFCKKTVVLLNLNPHLSILSCTQFCKITFISLT